VSRAALACLLAGCGGASVAPEAPANPELVRGTGGAVTFDAMIDDLATARAVYVGEYHGTEADHALEARIFTALYERDPSLALGMEMFERSMQPILDEYVAATIDEAEFLRRVEWTERWGVDFEHYRPLLSFARSHHLAVIALNAPKEITRKVAERGLDGLSEEERASLPELVLDDARHRAMIEGALGGHGPMGAARLERFYAAQVIWDETMAESVARVLAAENAPTRVMVIAGAMHVRSGLGIPSRAARRGVTPFRIVLPVTRAPRDRQEADLGDYLWVR
jgi:uncharacterized iron-regulated protein